MDCDLSGISFGGAGAREASMWRKWRTVWGSSKAGEPRVRPVAHGCGPEGTKKSGSPGVTVRGDETNGRSDIGFGTSLRSRPKEEMSSN